MDTSTELHQKLIKIFYKRLFDYFGPQHWWPARTSLEVCIGAILTQNTSWINVERAIKNLESKTTLTIEGILSVSSHELKDALKPSGYFNQKAKKLICFLECVKKNKDNLDAYLKKVSREDLLLLYGIGEETADSILLYAAKKPHFVVDAYTKRILIRHGVIDKKSGYEDIQSLFITSLQKSVKIYNEYHALLVACGKTYCKKRKALCAECPLNKKEYFLSEKEGR